MSTINILLYCMFNICPFIRFFFKRLRPKWYSLDKFWRNLPKKRTVLADDLDFVPIRIPTQGKKSEPDPVKKDPDLKHSWKYFVDVRSNCLKIMKYYVYLSQLNTLSLYQSVEHITTITVSWTYYHCTSQLNTLPLYQSVENTTTIPVSWTHYHYNDQLNTLPL